eukprot:TRINITY_DN3899_c0_g1_i1.p2 TRINITY_DN3899_c0_g1~~TRINITY_DN3899_c0_g1_i1.p2  ORF type:complete len:192 (-),score=63.48 TRINITY_DN3899_c0_g1_i1:970-1545(-)
MKHFARNLALIGLCLFVLAAPLIAAEETTSATEADASESKPAEQKEKKGPSVDWDNLSKYSVKQLKKILSDRGMECKGCSEKSHLIQEAAKARDKPLIDKSKKSAAKDGAKAEASEDFDPSKMSSEEIMAWFNKKKQNEDKQKNELLEKLRAQGFKFSDDFQFSGNMPDLSKLKQKPPAAKEASKKEKDEL